MSRFLSFAAWNLAEFCTLEQLGEEMSTGLWFREVFRATFFFFVSCFEINVVQGVLKVP